MNKSPVYIGIGILVIIIIVIIVLIATKKKKNTGTKSYQGTMSRKLTVDNKSYTTTLDNQSTVDLTFKAAGQTIQTIPKGTKSSFTLQTNTNYLVTYPGQWAAQELFTMQTPFRDVVIQRTPVSQSGTALSNLSVTYN